MDYGNVSILGNHISSSAIYNLKIIVSISLEGLSCDRTKYLYIMYIQYLYICICRCNILEVWHTNVWHLFYCSQAIFLNVQRGWEHTHQSTFYLYFPKHISFVSLLLKLEYWEKHAPLKAYFTHPISRNVWRKTCTFGCMFF